MPTPSLNLIAWLPWIWLSATIVGLLVGAFVLMMLLRLAVRAMMRRASQGGESEATVRSRVEEIAQGVRPALAFVVILLAFFFTLRALGHPAALAWNPESILGWLLTRGVRIVLLLAGAFIVNRMVGVLASQSARLIRPHDQTVAAEIERQKRAQTIVGIIERFSGMVVAIVTTLMILSELGVNTTPILTGLGVVGVALGLGAQQMVGDLIAGFFLIFENQVRIGDVAVINGVSGLVQELRLRTTVLRGFDGSVYIFRNGTIQTLSNMTKDFSYFAMELPVPYKEDTDRVTQVIKDVAAELQADPQFSASILEPVDVKGIDRFSDTGAVLQFRIKTLPSKQWDLGREFRRRLKYRFQKDGIELPSGVVIAMPAPPAPAAPPTAPSPPFSS